MECLQIEPDDVPVVLCDRVGRQLRIICPFCGKFHYHGAGGGEGHRVAHCGTTAASARGYVLRLRTVTDRERSHNGTIA